MKNYLWFGSLAVVLVLLCVPRGTFAADVRDIDFPVLGGGSYSNDYGAPRVGHTHQGIDIFASKLTPLVAAQDGVVQSVQYPEPSYGWFISIAGDDGYDYWYLHINNDSPGTDDGVGGPTYAYALGVRAGWPVKKGQLIGYVGDSGNAESTAPHLHFEIHRGDGKTINPYLSLNAATRISNPVAAPLRDGEIQPFAAFAGGARIAAGDLDPTSAGDEIVAVAGPGGGPHVRIYSADHTLINQFFVPKTNFRGGLDVAVGDVNGNGVDDIILGLGRGDSPRVYIYTIDGLLLAQFDAYTPLFRGGVNVAAVDLNGDGTDEIITGPGAGGGPEVRAFSYTGNLLHAFFAYDRRWHGGVDVSGLDAIPGERDSRIVTGALAGGGPDVRIFDANGHFVSNYFAFYREFRGGVRVHVWDDPSQHEPWILTIPTEGLQSFVHRHTFGLQLLDEKLIFENWWFGEFDVTTANGKVYASTGRGRPADIQSRSYSY